MTDVSKDLPHVADLPRTTKKSTRTTVADIATQEGLPAADSIVGGMNFGIGHSFSAVLNCTGGTTTHGTTKKTVSSVNGCHDDDTEADF